MKNLDKADLEFEAIARRKLVTVSIDRFILDTFIPEMAEYCFVPYACPNDQFGLSLTQRIDNEAWQAAVAKDNHHQSASDLPLEAWNADVDQPAVEISDLGNRIATETQELEFAALRRDSKDMTKIVERMKLEIRAIEGLIKVQTDGIESAK